MKDYILIACYLDLFLLCMIGTKVISVPVSYVEEVDVNQSIEQLQLEEHKKVAITFDDGPHARYTSNLLDELAKRNVKATFFVTGEHASAYPTVIQQMTEQGHLIGNHTYSHMQLTNGNVETYKDELVATSQVIEELTGAPTEYVRPPYGVWEESLEAELDMIPIFWTVDPLDWCREDAQGIARSVLEEVEENDIILLHDSFKTSVEAAILIVDELLEQGYEFVTVEEIVME